MNLWIRDFLLLTFLVRGDFLAATESSQSLPCAKALRTVLEHFDSVKRMKISANDYWPIDGPPGDGMRYEEHFSDFIRPYDSFSNFLRARNKTGRSTHILDLFGAAVFVDEESVDSLTGVSLVDKYAKKRASRREVITGDLYQGDVWSSVEKRLLALKSNSFDLITIRPLGALAPYQQFKWQKTFKPSFDGELSPELFAFGHIYFGILKRSYDLLSSEDGHLLFQLPAQGFFHGNERGRWLQKLYRNVNRPKFTHGYARIIKTPDAGPLPIP